MIEEINAAAEKLAAKTKKRRKPQGKPAAELAKLFLSLVEQHSREILGEHKAELAELIAEAKRANAGTDRAKMYQTLDRLAHMRLAWQRDRIIAMGAQWQEQWRTFMPQSAKAEWDKHEFAELTAKYDAMPTGSKDERTQKMAEGWKLMDALRYPLGKCSECPNRGRRYPGALTAKDEGEVYPVCKTCNWENRKRRQEAQTTDVVRPLSQAEILRVLNATDKSETASGETKPARQQARAKRATRRKTEEPEGKRGKRAPRRRRSRETDLDNN